MTIGEPRDAKAPGIETIYQTLALADNIDAPGNVFLGREVTTRFGNLDDSAMEDATRKLMNRLNPKFKTFVVPVESLSGGQRQSVAIARAVHFNARILIMDEPTAALGPAETKQVTELVKHLQQEGIGIFLISHDIHDVYDLADRISVMLQGKLVGTVNKADVTVDEVLAMIILGKKPGEVRRRTSPSCTEPGRGLRSVVRQDVHDQPAIAGRPAQHEGELERRGRSRPFGSVDAVGDPRPSPRCDAHAQPDWPSEWIRPRCRESNV